MGHVFDGAFGRSGPRRRPPKFTAARRSLPFGRPASIFLFFSFLLLLLLLLVQSERFDVEISFFFCCTHKERGRDFFFAQIWLSLAVCRLFRFVSLGVFGFFSAFLVFFYSASSGLASNGPSATANGLIEWRVGRLRCAARTRRPSQ